MAWQTPITDRTEQDARLATPKGLLQAADMNRLEGNTAHLAQILKAAVDSRANGQRTDFVYAADFARPLAGIDSLKAAYFAPPSVPPTPRPPLNHWQKWNDAEEIQRRLLEIWQANRQRKVYCGEVAAAQGALL